MSAALLLAAWLAPLVVLPLAVRGVGRFWVPAAALPALLAAWLIPAGTTVEIPWLLLGVQLGLDAGDRVFLGFAALLWLAAGLYTVGYMHSDSHAARFRVFFLLAMSGNLGLIAGQDLVSFYLGFALMGLAAYGLVVHEGTPAVRRAGRVYLVMTLVSEVALFAGFLLLYMRTQSLTPAAEALAGAGPLELGLVTLAFSVKAGLIGVHLWLPLAHPAAPVPASAVLSGAMIKAALIGWMRYLPLGEESLPEFGTFLMVAGFATALLAVPLGLGQRDPKVVLAYSSIGKMGILVAGLGGAAVEPTLAPALVVALTFYAAHHGLAKGALFLGVGVVKSLPAGWPLGLLVLPALVLVGLPFTSGAMAKDLLQSAILQAPPPWAGLFLGLMPLSAAGSTLLMSRFLFLMHDVAGTAGRSAGWVALPWVGLVAVSLGLPLYWGGVTANLPGLWPVLLAAAVAWFAAWRRPALLVRWVGRVPPGDMLEPLTAAARRLGSEIRSWARRHLGRGGGESTRPMGEIAVVLSGATDDAEARLGGRAVAGVLWFALAGALLLLIVLG